LVLASNVAPELTSSDVTENNTRNGNRWKYERARQGKYLRANREQQKPIVQSQDRSARD